MNSAKNSAKKSSSKKGSVSKANAPIEQEDDLFRALKSKKESPKVQQVVEEEEVDEEVPQAAIDDELVEGEDDELDQDEFAGDVGEEEIEDDEFADELEGEEDGEFADEEGPVGLPPGYGQEPDPEDEYKGIGEANPKNKILGLTANNTEVDMALVRMKIEETLKILAKFQELKDPERTRKSYIEEFKANLQTYYGYNTELIDLFLNTFSPGECVQFLEANEQQRPSTIRTNTLKTNRKHLAQILMQRGVSLEPLAEWSKVGIKIFESKVPIGATPEYLAGHYMLQSVSSFLPVIALAPQMGERVLDMAAAPGGKTTYLAQLMKNTGIILANDVKLDRIKSLKFNLQRLGVNNCMVCNYDGRKLPGVMKGFDRVLLDAPCTGLGIISKDPSIKSQRVFIDVKKMSHLQKELITAAIDCCKPGGYVVYSTCSVTVEENEWVVDYALKNRYVKVVETGVEVGEEGYTKYMEKRFDNSLKLTKRILPHIHNMDGFYFAKLRKLQNGSRKEGETAKEKPAATKPIKPTEDKQKVSTGKAVKQTEEKKNGKAKKQKAKKNVVSKNIEAFDTTEEANIPEEVPQLIETVVEETVVTTPNSKKKTKVSVQKEESVVATPQSKKKVKVVTETEEIIEEIKLQTPESKKKGKGSKGKGEVVEGNKRKPEVDVEEEFVNQAEPVEQQKPAGSGKKSKTSSPGNSAAKKKVKTQ